MDRAIAGVLWQSHCGHAGLRTTIQERNCDRAGFKSAGRTIWALLPLSWAQKSSCETMRSLRFPRTCGPLQGVHRPRSREVVVWLWLRRRRESKPRNAIFSLGDGVSLLATSLGDSPTSGLLNVWWRSLDFARIDHRHGDAVATFISRLAPPAVLADSTPSTTRWTAAHLGSRVSDRHGPGYLVTC